MQFSANYISFLYLSLIKKLNYISEYWNDIKICWLIFLFIFLNECNIIISNTWFSDIVFNLFFPYGVNPLLIFIFLIWIYIWGISNLRRALYGKFTRGDRRLWFKSFASFWISEFFTIGGLYIVSCWMSWGPAPVYHRNFLIPLKSFVFELSLFTFIVWSLYLLRFFIKWNSWKTSSVITVFIIFIISCLLWRDFMLFWGREVLNFSTGSRWRYIEPQIIHYSISPSWWAINYIGNENLFFFNSSIDQFMKHYLTLSSYTEYESSNLLKIANIFEWSKFIGPSSFIIDVSNFFKFNAFDSSFSIDDYSDFNFLNLSLEMNTIYPRRVGFATKKLAMWNLFMMLKMFHHFILFYWWFVFLLRLQGTKKNSYSLLSTCWFNVYCCFVIGLLVYIFSIFPYYENFLRLKPYRLRNEIFRSGVYNEALNYVLDLFTINKRSYEYNISEMYRSIFRLGKLSMSKISFFREFSNENWSNILIDYGFNSDIYMLNSFNKAYIFDVNGVPNVSNI